MALLQLKFRGEVKRMGEHMPQCLYKEFVRLCGLYLGLTCFHLVVVVKFEICANISNPLERILPLLHLVLILEEIGMKLELKR